MNNIREKENIRVCLKIIYVKKIKENCIIKINNKIIEFNYFYKFNKGKYKVEYIFINKITKTDYIFQGCFSFTNINLSNFNTQKVTNMSCMFNGCHL